MSLIKRDKFFSQKGPIIRDGGSIWEAQNYGLLKYGISSL